MGERLMTIYIDNDYKCHTSSADGLTAVETDAFDGKCRQYIEGYRFVPAGETWTREDGEVFTGEMVAPWRPYEILAELQAVYDEQQQTINEYEAALSEIEQALEV